MNLETKIKMAMAFKNISQSKLAELIGTSPQNFNKKLKRETLSPEELEKIAKALGATYHCYFEFEDGTKI
ncbi:helix-turn-helix domain-containing protein [Thomasclavelia cocleata]|uniref:helix-turn-helix domain-containing protein n=1 Tax=Thomasclavelia cocleata TaxID=69824 RepID=UPI0024322060|nr:helix-turn-helix transcriptional regulator [Thomasclavelia cocleata]